MFEHGFLSQITITTGEVSSEAESKVEAVEIILGEKKMAAITSKVILQSKPEWNKSEQKWITSSKMKF